MKGAILVKVMLQYGQGMLTPKAFSMHFEWNKQVQLSGLQISVKK